MTLRRMAMLAPYNRWLHGMGRGYDMENEAILFRGEAYELGPVSRAVEELQGRAEAEMRKPRFDT